MCSHRSTAEGAWAAGAAGAAGGGRSSCSSDTNSDIAVGRVPDVHHVGPRPTHNFSRGARSFPSPTRRFVVTLSRSHTSSNLRLPVSSSPQKIHVDEPVDLSHVMLPSTIHETPRARRRERSAASALYRGVYKTFVPSAVVWSRRVHVTTSRFPLVSTLTVELITFPS